MALTLENYPLPVEFTKNPIVFSYSTDMFDEYDARMYLKIQVDKGGGYNFVAELEKRPNDDHKYVFDISEILDQVIQKYDFLLPEQRNYDDPLQYATKNQIKYKVTVEEHYGDPDTKDDSPDPIEGYAVKGGLTHELFPVLEPFFNSYLVNTKMFLTWLPNRITISRWQPVILFLFNYSGTTWTDLQVEFICTFQDPADNTLSNITTTKSAGTLAENKILMIPADPAAAELFDLDGTKNLVSYIVTVYDGETIVSESRIYDIDLLIRFHEKTFAYINSLGGIDHVRCIGKWDPKADYSSGSAEKIHTLDLHNPRASYDGLEHLKTEFAISESFSHKVISGPKSLKEIHCFRDFRLSPWKAEYMTFGGRYLPINIDNKSIDFPKVGESPLGFEFTYRYAFDNRTFSPEALLYK